MSRSWMKWAVAAALIGIFLIMLAFCFVLWGGEDGDSAMLTVSTSFLASTLSTVVIIFAVLARQQDDLPSERYREKYMNDRK